MSKAHDTELQRVAAMARQISGSPAWSKILDSTERRVRFEDGFIQGWFAGKVNAKPAPKYRKVGEVRWEVINGNKTRPVEDIREDLPIGTILYVKRIPKGAKR
jgi:hypothetical protein